jgi:hypothetical protein
MFMNDEDALGALLEEFERILLERIFADAKILSPPLRHPIAMTSYYL